MVLVPPVFIVSLWLAGTDLEVPDPPPVPILGAEVCETCQWPATVLMSGCSGTLIHPEVVLYAAHCPSASSVRFGVTGNDRSVGTDYCRGAPEYPQKGFDYKFCKLSSPVTDVPIAPILLGCERAQLPVEAPVVAVGYGRSSNAGGGFGTKRWVDAVVAGFLDRGKLVGLFYADNNTGTCSGDSGGSSYVRLADGTWRAWGIHVTHVGGGCGGSSQDVPMWNTVAFIEEESGIDVTPCHDVDGAWNPGPDCGAFPMDPNDGSGLSWGQGCGPGMISGVAETCGPAAGEPPDTTAPTIEIIAPAPGAYSGPTFGTPIEISASDDWGILDVSISFDGVKQAFIETAPYKIGSVNFPEGTWEIGATGRDWSGNLTTATPVVIEVGPDETGGSTGPSTAGPDSDGASDSGGDTGPPTDSGPAGTAGSSETMGDTDGSGQVGGDAGCGCRVERGAWPVWLFLPLLGLRRRCKGLTQARPSCEP